MADERMICKHCGGQDFHADVEIRAEAWVDSTGVWVGDDGKPHFEPDGSPQDEESYGWDYDINRYVCSTCDKGHYRLTELVVAAPADGDVPIAPCGRCDHARGEHPEKGPVYLNYVRGAMRCTHEGCDCHDYYDLAVAEAGQPPELLAALRSAA